MPTSSDWRHRQTWVVLGLTTAVGSVLLLLAWIVPLETRNSRGEVQDNSAFDVWRSVVSNVPDDAPFFLAGPVLAFASVIAVYCFAYVLVAIARLPHSRTD